LYLEYYGGGTLYDMVEKKHFSENVCRVLFSQMLQGLKHMHELGLFHFDLKLENIMIDGELELANFDGWVKIVDFGGVKPVDKEKNGFTNYHNHGTLLYNAPEIHSQKPYKGAPVDVFALGYVLFAMVLGRPPFGIAKKKKDFYYAALAKGNY
jgi:serine/threonine protein kinase